MAEGGDLNALLRWSTGLSGSNGQGEARSGLSTVHAAGSDNRTDRLDAAVDRSVDPSAAPRPIDTRVLDAMFGESVHSRLRRNLEVVAQRERYNLDDRLTALDEFEMLIEDIDNANLIQTSNLWPRLVAEMFDDGNEIQIRRALMAIAKTAVQNNPKGQAALTKNDVIPRLLDILRKPPSGDRSEDSMRSKSISCLSSLLSRNGPALDSFALHGGFDLISDLLTGEQAEVSWRAAFLVTNLAISLRDKEVPQEQYENHLATSNEHSVASVQIEESQRSASADEAAVLSGAPLESITNPRAPPPARSLRASLADAGIPSKLADIVTGGPNAVIYDASARPDYFGSIMEALIACLIAEHAGTRDDVPMFRRETLIRLQSWYKSGGGSSSRLMSVDSSVGRDVWHRLEKEIIAIDLDS